MAVDGKTIGIIEAARVDMTTRRFPLLYEGIITTSATITQQRPSSE
jgi:hypothetical protein